MSMKKIGLALLVILSSCSAEKESSEMYQDVKQISVQIEEMVPEGSESRVLRNDEGKFVWEKNDTLGIFPNVGGQVEFPIDAKFVGTSRAEFDGGGWALRNNYTYSAYCPFNFYNRNAQSIPVSYVVQTQNGNNSKSHLSDKIFMASPPVDVVDGGLTFQMKHLCTLTELTLTLPVVATYTSVDIYTSDEILPVEVAFNLKSAELTQTNIEYSNHYTVKLNNVKTTTKNEDVTVWFATPVVVDADKTLKAVVKDSQGYVYVADIITSSGNIATVNFKRANKRTLKASPILTDGFQGGIEDWVNDGQDYGGIAN